jgi:hypothetical protein
MPTYSCDMGKEAAIMATISLVLTGVNIICILITATLVLKVTPNFSSYLSIFINVSFTKDIFETNTYRIMKIIGIISSLVDHLLLYS